MADMSPEIDDKAVASELCILLDEHKGADVMLIDLRALNAWTDFFVIATASSAVHMDGLDRHIKEFCRQRNVEIFRKSPRPSASEDEWRLIDLGNVVVHIMSKRAREFYELERLWGPF